MDRPKVSLTDVDCAYRKPETLRVRSYRCYAFGCMVAIRGGYRMARGWHYTKLYLPSVRLLSFSGMCFVLLFLSFYRLCLVYVRFVFMLLLELCTCLKKNQNAVRPSEYPPVPLICSCPAEHVPDWQRRILLGTVEARSANVKYTTTSGEAIKCQEVVLSVQPIHNPTQTF